MPLARSSSSTVMGSSARGSRATSSKLSLISGAMDSGGARRADRGESGAGSCFRQHERITVRQAAHLAGADIEARVEQFRHDGECGLLSIGNGTDHPADGNPTRNARGVEHVGPVWSRRVRPASAQVGTVPSLGASPSSARSARLRRRLEARCRRCRTRCGPR